MRYTITKLMPAAITLILYGCGSVPQHSNTLVFGTDTKVALDVSSSPANAGALGFTLGYKRVEAVWMPLLANKILGSEAIA